MVFMLVGEKPSRSVEKHVKSMPLTTAILHSLVRCFVCVFHQFLTGLCLFLDMRSIGKGRGRGRGRGKNGSDQPTVQIGRESRVSVMSEDIESFVKPNGEFIAIIYIDKLEINWFLMLFQFLARF